MVRLGHEVTIFCPFRLSAIDQSFSSYYGVDSRIRCVTLGSFDPIDAWWLPGILGLWSMNFLLRKYMHHALVTESFDSVYTRSPALLPALLLTGKPVILELHQLPRFRTSLLARYCNRCTRVACLTTTMRAHLIAAGVQPERIIVASDAVAIERFAQLPTAQEARAHFGIVTDRIVVGYVGRLKTLGQEKGVGILLRALKQLSSQQRYYGCIVGGPDSDRKEYESLARSLGLTSDEVCFVKEIPSTEVPKAMVACDILAMPLTDFPLSRNYMSPLKMFEYMATHRPIVTSDLPTIRDVLSEETAVFCDPGDPVSLANALEWVRDHPQAAAQRATAAFALVQEHTWTKRMERILAL